MNNAPPEGWGRFDLPRRLANRAIYFHSLIKANQGKPKGSLDGLEVVPLDAGIHREGDRANQPRTPRKGREEGKEEDDAIPVTNEYITLTSSSGITPGMPGQQISTPSGGAGFLAGPFMPMATGSPTFPAPYYPTTMQMAPAPPTGIQLGQMGMPQFGALTPA